MTEDILLVQDSREKQGYRSLFKHECVVKKLDVGDYSAIGLENVCAVERKSLDDLVQSLTHHRNRFERMLVRSRSLEYFAIIVESGPTAILSGLYRSDATPASVWESCAAFSVRYRAPFFFLGSREHAAKWTESIIVKYAYEIRKRAALLDKATREMQVANG